MDLVANGPKVADRPTGPLSEQETPALDISEPSDYPSSPTLASPSLSMASNPTAPCFSSGPKQDQAESSAEQPQPAPAKPDAGTPELGDAAIHALAGETDRRRSGRVRHVPKEFVPEPIKPKAPRTTTKAKSKKKAEQKPSLIAKVRYANLTPRPPMTPIELDCSLDVFWLRLNLREFLLRFDKLCRLPTRHATTINDPLQPWNDYLYKATLVALFRLIENDNVPIFEYARHYLNEIEHTPAESATLWSLVYEFLEQSDPYLNAADELSGEHYRLELIRRMMVLATGTETIRLTILNDHEQLRQLQMDQGDKIKAISSHLTESVRKLEKLKSSDMQLYADRVAAAERSAADKKFRAEQTLHAQTHKYTLRTNPLGQDTDGNLYWNFQQKSKDIPSWGTWIVCEMVWPSDLDEKRTKAFRQQISQLLRTKKKAKPEVLKITIPKQALQSVNSEPDKIDSNKIEVDKTEETKVLPQPTKPAESEPVKKKRKPMVPPKQKTLCYVAGKDNINALANWIKNQLGAGNEKLVSDLESIACYIQE